MQYGKKIWKEIYFKDRNEHGEIDLQQSINLLTNYTLEILWKRQICVFFVAARGSWPQFMVSEGGKESKALLMAFLHIFPITIQPATAN